MAPTEPRKRSVSNDSDDRDRKRRARRGLFGNGNGVKGLECWYFFIKGSCRWGDQCKYSHMPTGRRAEQPVPDGVGTTAGKNARTDHKVYTKWQGTKKPKVYEPPLSQRLAAIAQQIGSDQASQFINPGDSHGSTFKIKGRATIGPHFPQTSEADIQPPVEVHSNVDEANRQKSATTSGSSLNPGQLADAQTDNPIRACTFSSGGGTTSQPPHGYAHTHNAHDQPAIRALNGGYSQTAHHSLELPTYQQDFRITNPPSELQNYWQQGRPAYSYVFEKPIADNSSLTPPSIVPSYSANDGRSLGDQFLGSNNSGSPSPVSLSALDYTGGEAQKAMGPHYVHPDRQRIFADSGRSQPLPSRVSEAVQYREPTAQGQPSALSYDSGGHLSYSSVPEDQEFSSWQQRQEDDHRQVHPQDHMGPQYDHQHPGFVDQQNTPGLSSIDNSMPTMSIHRSLSHSYSALKASTRWKPDNTMVALSPPDRSRTSTESSRHVSAESTLQHGSSLSNATATVSTSLRAGADQRPPESMVPCIQVHELGVEHGERNRPNGPRQQLNPSRPADLHSNFSPADAPFLTNPQSSTKLRPQMYSTRTTSDPGSKPKPLVTLPAILSLPTNATTAERVEHSQTIVAELTQHVRWLNGIQIVGRRLKALDHANNKPQKESLSKQVDSSMEEIERLLQTVRDWKDGLEKANSKSPKKVKAKVVGWEKHEKRVSKPKETENTEKAFL